MSAFSVAKLQPEVAYHPHRLTVAKEGVVGVGDEREEVG